MEVIARANASVQNFMDLISLRTSSALLGSFQNSGLWVSFSFSSISVFLLSMSKEPPQGFKPLIQCFNLFL